MDKAHAMSSNPRTAAIRQLRPTNWRGCIHGGFALLLSCAAVTLSLSENAGVWFAGQLLLAAAFLLWFALLHEAGHQTLFRSRGANQAAGHFAGFLALIPYSSWQPIHKLHHRWTGWQDLDPTTAVLTPRARPVVIRWTVNVCWFLWIPLFAVLYRIGNYWNLPRLWRIIPDKSTRWWIALCIACYLIGYGALLALCGAAMLAKTVGVALLLTLMAQDLLILSQHTHIPMPTSGGEKVRPWSAERQEEYTRSLEFPRWFSQWILLNLDAHELHHAHPRVPGYCLPELSRPTQNSLPWWLWVWRARRIRGEVLLFQNRDQTGHPI